MATIQPLKEDQNRSVLLVTGTGSESGTVVVNGAALCNGILSVKLERIVPEEKKPRLIDIVEVK